MKASTTRAAASARLIALLFAVGLAGMLLAFGITTEVPLGGFSGKTVMSENGKPLPDVTIQLTPVSSGDNGAMRYREDETDEDGAFEITNVVAGDYTVAAYSKSHKLEEQRVTVKEGKPTEMVLSMKPQDPDFTLETQQRIFSPTEKPNFQMKGFLPDEQVGIDIFKIDLQSVVKRGSIGTLLAAFARYSNSNDDPAKYGKVVRHIDYKITGKDIEGSFVDQISVDPLPEGFYLMRCQAGKIARYGYMNVSTIGLVVKSGTKSATCYVSDLVSGNPIDEADLSLAQKDALKSVGQTRPDGTREVDLPAESRHLLVAQKGSSIAVVDFYGTNGEGDDEEVGANTKTTSGRIYVYSDRPIYRPGDTVQFKGIARKLDGLDFAVPHEGTVQGELRDPDDNLIQTFKWQLNNRGTFSGQFATNKEAKPGLYTLLVNGPGGRGRMNVNVAAYRKPEFKITVTPEKQFYVFGEKGRAKVKCEYYFGGPVVGAKISAYVTRSPYWTWGDADEDAGDQEYYSDETGSGENVDQIQAVADDNGEAVVEFDTQRPQEKDYGLDSDYTYSIHVSVAAPGDKYFEGDGSVLVTRGTFGASLETSDYVGAIGTPTELTVRAFSHDGKQPLAGKEFKILVNEDSWSKGVSHQSLLDTLTATTGADGSAKVTYSPKIAGSIVFKAVATDETKHEIDANAYFYVEGSGAMARPGGKLIVQLDKRKYQLGDTAKVMIQTDKPGGFALMTVEADEVLYQKVVNLTQAVTMVPLSVEKPFAPNARVSVAYVKDKQLNEASTDLVLDLVQQKLKIGITPDRDKLLPGQTVNYEITTMDGNGQPVSADLSLGVVDESIYAIKEDHNDPYKGFFPRRSINVQTTYSFQEVYLDGGDKGGGNIPIRSKFADTAFWQPNLHTDATGKTTVAVTLPDNLTTWRATAVAVTDSTAVGIQTTKIRASKPLTIRLEMPGFMVVQDRQKMTAVVQNDTGQAADVQVRLNIKGASVDGPPNQTVHVEPGTPKSVEWDLTAAQTGSAEVTATAEITGGANDGVRQSFDVKPHGRDYQDIHSGMVKGDASFDMVVRNGADRNTGRLVLSLSPSIATTLVQSLDGLVKYPYGCVEQTMSRFLPAILVDKTLSETGLSRPDLHAKVPGIAADGMARLAKMQHGDGGWGWWEWDDSDPFMTALVLDGLHRATVAGYKVNESMVKRGLDWAEKRFESAKKTTDIRRDLVYLCFALAENGRIASAKKVFKFDFTGASGSPLPSKALLDDAAAMGWPQYGILESNVLFVSEHWAEIDKPGASDLALAAMTANLLGKDYVGQRDMLMAKLRQSAVVSGDTASWPEDWYCWGAEGTALGLTALVTISPTDPLIPKVVRSLMTTRRGDSWSSTRDTAYVLVGMTAYLKQTRELAIGNGELTVTVNGKPVKTVAFGKDVLLQPDLEVTVPMADLQVGKNTVEIKQSGNGVCYYSADLRQVVADSSLAAETTGNGLTIKREYFKMESQRQEDGTMQLMPSSKPVTEVRSGDVIQCVITVKSDGPRQFVLVEDPVPSNCRVVERDAPYEDEQWGWWWASTVILDDRVSFFARDLPAGESQFKYKMRAEADGISSALPCRAGNMYDPSDMTSSSELLLKVIAR